ncbi:MAG: hypothetical protein ACXQT3_00050 [Methermicoccaceae archaeon]
MKENEKIWALIKDDIRKFEEEYYSQFIVPEKAEEKPPEERPPEVPEEAPPEEMPPSEREKLLVRALEEEKKAREVKITKGLSEKDKEFLWSVFNTKLESLGRRGEDYKALFDDLFGKLVKALADVEQEEALKEAERRVLATVDDIIEGEVEERRPLTPEDKTYLWQLFGVRLKRDGIDASQFRDQFDEWFDRMNDALAGAEHKVARDEAEREVLVLADSIVSRAPPREEKPPEKKKPPKEKEVPPERVGRIIGFGIKTVRRRLDEILPIGIYRWWERERPPEVGWMIPRREIEMLLNQIHTIQNAKPMPDRYSVWLVEKSPYRATVFDLAFTIGYDDPRWESEIRRIYMMPDVQSALIYYAEKANTRMLTEDEFVRLIKDVLSAYEL